VRKATQETTKEAGGTKAHFSLSHIQSGYYIEMHYKGEEIGLQYYSTAKEAIERAEHVALVVWGIDIMEEEV